MSQKTYLITGASGEIGTSLLEHFAAEANAKVVALDLNPAVQPAVSKTQHETSNITLIQGSVTDRSLIEKLERDFTFDTIYHLAGVLSTSGEKDPYLAHTVNVDGTLNLLGLAQSHSARLGKPTLFIFPSTIAVYGFRSLAAKSLVERVTEDSALEPVTMYGNNKLYCERLGEYFSKNFNMLGDSKQIKVDFRAIRFPGLISADTLPTGGTSDYGAEMVHAAAGGHPYICFVRPDTKLPFMVMPDAVKALLELAAADRNRLNQTSYNVTSFAVSAEEIATIVKRYYPTAQIAYRSHEKRQAICDSWPANISDDAARRDWNWKPDFDLDRAFNDYLMPEIAERYTVQKVGNGK